MLAHQCLDGPTLLRRAETARTMLHHCTMCEHRCGVDRIKGERAPCGLGAATHCFKRHVSFAEEIELLPSYMVYLSGCNFRCRFCVQGPVCFSPIAGEPVVPENFAAEFKRLIDRGAQTINLLGGEPSLHPHTILEIAAASAFGGIADSPPLPLVLNSNMYMTPEILDLLDGVVTIYLADFKFGNDGCAQRIANVSRYVEVITRNLKLAEAQPQAKVMIRHLLMPGHFECCFIPVADWIAANMPDAPFNLMTGYVPAWRTAGDTSELGRCCTEDEVTTAEAYSARLGLRGSG